VSHLLQGFLLAAIAVYFIMVFQLIRREKFLLRYGILWLLCGLVMLIFAIFPDLLIRFTGFLGVKVASNGLFAMSIFLVVVMLVFLTVVVTELTIRIRKMAQKTAIMEKRLRDMEEAKIDIKK